jgi:hypothetical protein
MGEFKNQTRSQWRIEPVWQGLQFRREPPSVETVGFDTRLLVSFHTHLRVEVIETIVPHLWFPTSFDVLRCSELASTTMFPLRWSSLPLHHFYFYTSYQVSIHLGLDYWQFLSLILTFQCPLWSLHKCFILILSYHKKGCNSVPSSLEGHPCTLPSQVPNSCNATSSSFMPELAMLKFWKQWHKFAKSLRASESSEHVHHFWDNKMEQRNIGARLVSPTIKPPQ